MNLYERMVYYREHACGKHELDPNCSEYAKNKLNEMTNAELVEALSDAFEELKVNFGTNDMD